VRVEETRAPVGGGSVPGLELASFAVALRSAGGVDDLAAALRAGEVPVLGRVQKEALLLDARTLLPGDDEIVERALARALVGGGA
jgi:L-seryl-tRNA(Ser) seleniumtransferase